MPRFVGKHKPLKKRALKPGEIFNPDIHIERRSRNERRNPWQRLDQNDRRSGHDRRRKPKGVKAAHSIDVKP